MDTQDIKEALDKALVRNYIKDPALLDIIRVIKNIRNKHKKIKKNIISVKLIRSNGENYGICIKYSNQWCYEYNDNLIRWSEETFQKKINCITTFHYIIQEYKPLPNINK